MTKKMVLPEDILSDKFLLTLGACFLGSLLLCVLLVALV